MTSRPETSDSFPIARGVNISHWLSQREVESPKPGHYFSELDVAFLKARGFDHIRLPVDEVILWDEKGEKRSGEWEKLHAALGWCHQYGLYAIVDLHVVRTHHFNSAFQGKENPLWTSEKAQDELVELWHKLSNELKDYPTSELAYEILNEPVAEDTRVWNRILNRLHAAIRRKEPRRKIIIGSNMWQKTRTVPELELPGNDPDIIISFHYYEPGTVTHYKSTWTALGEYDGPVEYPGIPYPEGALPDPPSPGLRKLLDEGNRPYDREVIRSEILTAVEFARSKGLQIYCGEWGCLHTVPREPRLRWIADVVSVFKEFGIGWTIWDYKGGFHIIDPQTLVPDEGVLEVILGNASSS